MNLEDAQKIIQEYGSRNMLTCDLFKEYSVNSNDLDKVYCSQWVNDSQVVFGTKCNKLMIHDIMTKTLIQIPSLNGRQIYPGAAFPVQTSGIHHVQMNPSRTLLSTGAKNSSEIAVYRLPTLEPVCLGEGGHNDLVFDTCWINDEFLVSGSRDTRLSLWRVDNDFPDAPDEADIPTHRLIQPLCVKQCQSAKKVRALAFNKTNKEIAAISLNGFIHIWSTETFEQKTSRKLPSSQEAVCLAIQDDKVYAIGCRSYTLLIDSRTLQLIEKIPSRYGGIGIRSTSFQGSLLTIGTGFGRVMFYDVRAQKYFESSLNSNGPVVLNASKGYVYPDQDDINVEQTVKYQPAIFTHCYDASGTRLFTAGGPLPSNLYGNYVGVWQ